MATVVISCQVTGSMDKEDRLAIIRSIDAENVRRAGLTPPLPALEKGTVAEMRVSYEAIFTPRLVSAHLSNIEESVEASTQSAKQRQLRRESATATQAQLDAALVAIKA